ncbi:MAG: methyltransferase domain-containing protein [Anaerolineae bacterium]|nr:methyltransferase domain-containing protein [Anaerolineae bacterium]NIN97863.1 methyltransferase domain-containing protein [Anaerolineae bacterium]NIQ80842.1 methyltransferase domain-containing protein [Anaerolineae bacterium]
MFLAEHGFEVTGVDFAAPVIEKARQKANTAGADVQFVVDDLTNLRKVNGKYDFLVDYGTVDDLGQIDRDLYVQNVVPLTHPGSRYLLWCFEWPQRWWERFVLFEQAFVPGEAQRRFGEHLEIERIAGTYTPKMRSWMAGFAAYLMTRRGGDVVGLGHQRFRRQRVG